MSVETKRYLLADDVLALDCWVSPLDLVGIVMVENALGPCRCVKRSNLRLCIVDGLALGGFHPHLQIILDFLKEPVIYHLRMVCKSNIGGVNNKLANYQSILNKNHSMGLDLHRAQGSEENLRRRLHLHPWPHPYPGQLQEPLLLWQSMLHLLLETLQLLLSQHLL